jgi:hypothetical protein
MVSTVYHYTVMIYYIAYTIFWYLSPLLSGDRHVVYHYLTMVLNNMCYEVNTYNINCIYDVRYVDKHWLTMVLLNNGISQCVMCWWTCDIIWPMSSTHRMFIITSPLLDDYHHPPQRPSASSLRRTLSCWLATKRSSRS